MTHGDPDELAFPPLMSGEAAPPGAVYERAVTRAALGCDAGLIVHALGADRMGAAMVFAPEVPLKQAVAMLPLCGVGFQNALGALAPPEVPVHLEWGGGIRVNGASCGQLRMFASGSDPDAVPDWLVVGFELQLMPASEETGETPDETALFVEGCADVQPPHLLEAWARHTLNWINRWEEPAGARALHVDWRGMAHGVGEPVTRDGRSGTFLGVDENFGMLLRNDDGTHLIPLTTLIEDTP
jgi:biotin-(acetyl-CoA carboxylase) ligase